VNSKHFGASTDFTKLKEADAILSACPRPSMSAANPILSYVEQTAISIYRICSGAAGGPRINNRIPAQRRARSSELEKSGLRCTIASGPENENMACDFYLAFLPERRRSGKQNQFGLAQIPRSSAGGIRPSAEPRRHSTRGVSRVVPVSSTRAAEWPSASKIFPPVSNIALCQRTQAAQLRMNIDIWEVIDAAATKLSVTCRFPGQDGRPLIPVDPYYLSWKAREFDFATRSSNRRRSQHRMPYHAVDAGVEFPERSQGKA